MSATMFRAPSHLAIRVIKQYALPLLRFGRGEQPRSILHRPSSTLSREASWPILRQLGEDEKFNFGDKKHRQRGFGNFMPYVMIQSTRKLTHEQVRTSLEKLHREVTILRTGICSIEGEKHFIELAGDIDFKIEETDDVKAVCESLQQNWYKEGELLWGARLLSPQSTYQGFLYPFLFHFQYCIADALTVNQVFLPRFLNYLEASFESGIRQEAEVIPLLPAWEDLLLDSGLEKPQKPITTLPTDLNYELAAKLVTSHRTDHPKPVRDTVGFTLNADDTKRLLKVPIEGTSFNSMCVAIAAMSTFKFLNGLGVIQEEKLTLPIPFAVNLRPYLSSRSTASFPGNYASDLLNSVTVGPVSVDGSNDTLWEMARSVHIQNRQLLAYPLPDESYITQRSTSEPALLYFSNVGRYTLVSEKGSIVATKVTPLDGVVPDLFLHMLGINKGKFEWQINYDKQFVSDELAESYLSYVKDQFGNVLEMLD